MNGIRKRQGEVFNSVLLNAILAEGSKCTKVIVFIPTINEAYGAGGRLGGDDRLRRNKAIGAVAEICDSRHASLE